MSKDLAYGHETFKMKLMKDKVGVECDPSGGNLARDFTKSEKKAYGEYMRDFRAKYGLVDGLRTDTKGFNEYLRRRRENDRKARGY